MNTSIIHPMIVHFPVALLLTSFLFISISLIFKKKDEKIFTHLIIMSFSLLSLGVLAAAAAILSGYLFTNDMVGIMGITRNNHIICAFITLAFGIMAAITNGLYLKNGKRSDLMFYVTYLLYVISAVMVGVTGHLGGTMVFGF